MTIILCGILVIVIISVLLIVWKKKNTFEMSDRQIYRYLKKVPKQIKKRTNELIKQYENNEFNFVRTPRLEEDEKCYGKFTVCITKQGLSKYHRIQEEFEESWTLYITWKRIIYESTNKTVTYNNDEIRKIDFNIDSLLSDLKILKKNWTVNTYKIQQEDYVEFWAIIGLINYLSDKEKLK